MSKIAEQKALEAYPQKYDNLLDTNVHRRIGYRQGYEQAMQDFLEKAEKVLTERMYFSDDEAKQFKNYIQNEN